MTKGKRAYDVAGPDHINVRFKLGVLEVNDVAQSVRMDVNIFFYFKPSTQQDFTGFYTQHVRFENIEPPKWTPNFDFNDEIEETIKGGESYWLDLETGLIFGRINFIALVQERFDHHPFPYDRQIINFQTMMDNCLVEPWDLHDLKDYPPELQLRNKTFVSQCELNAVADGWDMVKFDSHCLNDKINKSSILNFQIFLERQAKYYFWNIVFVYFLIIVLKGVIYAFPYTNSRFEFGLTLALTTVAFKFVISELVPKTSYLTYLDKYMLLGLIMLTFRFVMGLMIQTLMLDEIPFGPDATRAECPEDFYITDDGNETEYSLGVSPCYIDFVVTMILFTFWVCASAFMGLCVFVPNLARPDWNYLDTKSRHNYVSKNIKTMIRGNTEWHAESDIIAYADLEDYYSSHDLHREVERLRKEEEQDERGVEEKTKATALKVLKRIRSE